ncbi:hypothetical protein D3C81_2149570 [compost metagenome]
MDNFALVALLNRLGYEGYLGWQGWGEGGDVFAKLERSLAALKSMTARAIQNPHWASYIDHA